MKIPNDEAASRPWRIGEVVPDFRLEDAWALPTPGGPDDFPRLVRLFAELDPAKGANRLVKALAAVRFKLGERFGWDEEDRDTMPTLRDRLPADLRDGPTGPVPDALPFRPLYLRDHEWAAELANRTMHGILHLGWVPDGEGGYRGELAVYVRPNGFFGRAYMAAIKPFRLLIVYPALMRACARLWQAQAGDVTPGRTAAPA